MQIDEGDPGPVRARLLSPQKAADWRGLAEAWRQADFTWRIAGHGKLIADPALAGRMRGAFGEALVASASPQAAAGEPCPWDPPCAFEILFRNQGRREPGIDFPAPWVIGLDQHRGDLLVRLSLFGFAIDYAVAAAEAMAAALAGRVRYDLSRDIFLPAAEITRRAFAEMQGIDLDRLAKDPSPSALLLEFLQPVAQTSASPIEKPQSLPMTLAARIAGFARWHDLGLEFDRQLLRECVRRLSFEWVDPRKVSWTRRSGQQGRVIPMSGYLGTLTVEGTVGDLKAIAPLLALGERVFAGADTAFGCGRYRLGRA